MANEARLNLVISARDEAKTVIESFVSDLTSMFKGLQDSSANLFNMDGLKNAVSETVNSIKQDFDSLNASNGVSKAFQDMTETVFMSRDKLEEAFMGVRESFNNVSLSATEASQLTSEQLRNIVQAANGMKIEVTQSADETANAMQHISESLDFMNLQMAGEMIQHVGEQVTGFFEHAVSSAADFDQNIVNTTASLNANLGTMKLSTAQIKAMQDAAISMGQAGFYSANAVAESMNVMSKNGLTYQQIMSGGIQTVYKVAAANQADIAETANVVSDIYNEMGDIFKSTGMTAQQAAQQIGNSMTVAMHHARISMDDFMTTMKYVGPQASAVGVGIKDVASLISLLGQHAIRGSQAGEMYAA